MAGLDFEKIGNQIYKATGFLTDKLLNYYDFIQRKSNKEGALENWIEGQLRETNRLSQCGIPRSLMPFLKILAKESSQDGVFREIDLSPLVEIEQVVFPHGIGVSEFLDWANIIGIISPLDEINFKIREPVWSILAGLT